METKTAYGHGWNIARTTTHGLGEAVGFLAQHPEFPGGHEATCSAWACLACRSAESQGLAGCREHAGCAGCRQLRVLGHAFVAGWNDYLNHTPGRGAYEYAWESYAASVAAVERDQAAAVAQAEADLQPGLF